jgi:EmrB/QacA subfamily drug resistance transporter
MGTAAARWVLLATVLGSGVAFLDGTIVNVALPTIAEDLGASLGDLQWVLDAYLVTLSALLLLGGALGDRYGRRFVFRAGLAGFTGASVLCGAAPNVEVLIAARAVQGVGAALLVPGSLAILSAVFHPDDRARAVGAWSGLSGIATAIGPFAGGWLIDSVSWRLAFLVNVPLAAMVAVASGRVPETRAAGPGRLDVTGALAASVGLAVTTYGLIEQVPAVTVAGVLALVGFLLVEARVEDPMLPLGLFRSRQFSGANAATFAVYAALGGATFLLVLELQVALDYSALEAGAALLPVTILMLVLSSRAGALAQRIGPRLPMTLGPIGVAVGLVLFARVEAGTSYATTLLPAAVVFGLGLSLTVAPLTATIMSSADDEHLGSASGINNAVARLAGLLAVALLPSVVGLDTAGGAAALDTGVDDAMIVCAVLAVLGGCLAWATAAPSAARTRPRSRSCTPAATPASRTTTLGADPPPEPATHHIDRSVNAPSRVRLGGRAGHVRGGHLLQAGPSGVDDGGGQHLVDRRAGVHRPQAVHHDGPPAT